MSSKLFLKQSLRLGKRGRFVYPRSRGLGKSVTIFYRILQNSKRIKQTFSFASDFCRSSPLLSLTAASLGFLIASLDRKARILAEKPVGELGVSGSLRFVDSSVCWYRRVLLLLDGVFCNRQDRQTYPRVDVTAFLAYLACINEIPFLSTKIYLFKNDWNKMHYLAPVHLH